MKVALCLSGQMRGYLEAFPSIKKNIIDKFNPDVFIHTWSDIGISNNEHRRRLPGCFAHYLDKDNRENKAVFDRNFPKFSSYINQSPQVSELELTKLYQPKSIVIEDSPDESEYDQFFNCPLPEEIKSKQPKATWSRPLFYKIYKCNELKKDFEKLNNFEYDLVIRLRPDLSIGEPIPDTHVSNLNKIYHRIRTIDVSFQMSDQFFYGNSRDMDIACAAYSKINELWRLCVESGDDPKYYWAESLFFKYLSVFTNIKTQEFRTERPDQKSNYQLLSYSGDRLGYIESKSLLFSDIRNQKKDKIKNRMLCGMDHVLKNHIHSLIKVNDISIEIAKALCDEFEKELETPPYYSLLYVSYLDENQNCSIEFIEYAANRFPRSNSLYYLISLIYRKDKDYIKAVQYGEKALLLNEFNSQRPVRNMAIYRCLGYCYESLGQYENAFWNFLSALSLNDNDSALNYRVGKNLYYLGRYEASMSYLSKCLEINPEHDACHYFNLHSKLKLKMFMEVKSEAKKLLVHYEGDDCSIKFLGPLALSIYYSGHKYESYSYIKKYISYKKYNLLEMMIVPEVLFEMGKYKEAMKILSIGGNKYSNSVFYQDNISSVKDFYISKKNAHNRIISVRYKKLFKKILPSSVISYLKSTLVK